MNHYNSLEQDARELRNNTFIFGLGALALGGYEGSPHLLQLGAGLFGISAVFEGARRVLHKQPNDTLDKNQQP